MINSPGVNEFIDLADAPNSYVGQATKVVKVNAGETAVEFGAGGGGAGTVTDVSSANADISVATPTTTPVLTLNSATTATASTIVKRDANVNIYNNNNFTNSTSTVSAGGTTVLTVASSMSQTLTGASSQTYQLPDATTCPISSMFHFNNNSSGSLIIVNASSSTQYTVPAGGHVDAECTANGTVNGSWDFHAQPPASVTWGSGITGITMNSVLTTSPSIGAGASSSTAPSFIPQRGALTTGFGGDGTDLHGTIAGVARLTISATGITATNLSGTNTGDQTGGTPALTLGTANTAGASTNFIRRDDTILVFDATSPSTQAFGDAAVVGVATVAARRDHKHAMMAAPTTVSGNAGTATALQNARTIGTLTGDVTSAGSSFDGTGNNTNSTTVTKINGTTLSGLATGILKNTTGTGVPSIAINSDLPAMSATVGGAVPTPPNNTTTFLRGDGTFATPTASATITTQEEGVTLSSTVTTLNFVGAGVTASGAGATTTVTIPGGSGSGITLGLAVASVMGFNRL